MTKIYKLNEYKFYFLNIFIPLLLGVCVYVIFRPDTYIARCLYILFPTSVLENIQVGTEHVFCKNFMCDMLWAYALYAAVAVCVGTQNRITAGGISWGLCIFVEVLQQIGLLNGTGDVWDVMFEGVAIVAAIVVITIYERKGKTNEKENKENFERYGCINSLFSDGGR